MGPVQYLKRLSLWKRRLSQLLVNSSGKQITMLMNAVAVIDDLVSLFAATIVVAVVSLFATNALLHEPSYLQTKFLKIQTVQSPCKPSLHSTTECATSVTQILGRGTEKCHNQKYNILIIKYTIVLQHAQLEHRFSFRSMFLIKKKDIANRIYHLIPPIFFPYLQLLLFNCLFISASRK